MTTRKRLAATCLALLLATPALAASSDGWDPAAWRDEDTIELRTTTPGEEPHWFKVWLVVLDGQVYVRLGDRAARRFEQNAAKPVVAVRIAGREFPEVTGVPVPEMADRVAAAMADKYWSDVFVRFMSHPLTLRLVQGASPAQPTR
jgi:hypothetical protein